MEEKHVTAESVLRSAAKLRWELGDTVHDKLVDSLFQEAARIGEQVVTVSAPKRSVDWDHILDRLFTSKLTGFPIMFLMFAGVFWLTITGANYPSAMIASFLIETIHPALKGLAASLGMPWWLDGILIDGAYLATAWVISVMLPPMAIFFPLFTLLEDFGYLPRVAFNLDYLFKRVGAHGKQTLTMCMGYGCNAAGVIAARIIDSPRERLIAILTNNFAVCNGRWPTLFLVATIFIGGQVQSPALASALSSLAVVTVALLGIALTFLISLLLSQTALRGEPSVYSLELPPYRPPRIVQTLYTSLIDRTVFVLWRAVMFALPAGAAIWAVSNITANGITLAEHAIRFLEPFGFLIGLNGIILLAYIIAIPANEIVIPTVLMLTVLTARLSGVGEGAGVMFELESTADTATLLTAGNWTLLTAVNLLIFCLCHTPCSTTLYTIWKETRSVRWTVLSALLPLGVGLVLCFFIAQVWRLAAGP